MTAQVCEWWTSTSFASPSRPELSADGRFVGAYGDTTEVALHVYDLADNDNFTPPESVRSNGTAV